jgi:uncharacterized protein
VLGVGRRKDRIEAGGLSKAYCRHNKFSIRYPISDIRYLIPLLLAFLLLVLVFPTVARALDVPQLKGHVNDYANILSPAEVGRLEAKLTQFEQTDSTQIAVLTIPALEGEDLEGYSIRVAETWKIGWKGLDNGVILLISQADKKIRIEVGRGLEGKLTDLVSGRIIRTTIVPYFRKGDFNGGVEAGATAIIEAVRGEFKAKDRGTASGVTGKKSSGSSMFTLAIFLVIALLFLAAISKVVGAIAGSIGLPIVGSLAFGALSLPILAALGGAGLLLGLFLAFLAGHHRGGGWGGGPFMGGGWGGSSGSDFGGGGSDFGGGGGDFGGGGASGDW